MQTFTQRYTIIQLFEEAPEGTQFPASSWPLHTTVVDTFAIDWDVSTLIKELSKLLASCQATFLANTVLGNFRYLRSVLA